MEEKKLISMKEAARISPYQQGYLSLLARRGELRAEKVGRNWFTTIDWLNEYIEEKKPDKVIAGQAEKNKKWLKIKEKKEFFWLAGSVFLLVFLVGYWFWEEKWSGVKVEDLPSGGDIFVSEEIIKIPNESGGYDVYESGRRRVGEE